MKKGKKYEEKSNVKVLLAVFFILAVYVAISPFSKFIRFIPESVSKSIIIIDYIIGGGLIVFFFTKHSILSFREVYSAVKGSRFVKGFLLFLFIFFLVSLSSYLLLIGTSLIWTLLTTLIGGLLLSSFIFYYIKYINLSLTYSEEKITKEFKARRKKNSLLFSAFVGLLFIIPAIIFLLNLPRGKFFLILSILSWLVFALGVFNYIKYVTLRRKV